MIRTRAADDYKVIRSRIEELRREKTGRVSAERGERAPQGPRPYHVATIGIDRSDAGLPTRILTRAIRERIRSAVTLSLASGKPDPKGQSPRRQTPVAGVLEPQGRSSSISLREACHLVGCDSAGARCPNCTLASHCSDDSRWLVRRQSRII
jgi:hypothetical protein